MKIYNITHSSDIDGLASAALLAHCYGMPARNVFFSQPSGKQFEDSVKLIKRLAGKGNLLVLTDLAMNKSNNKKMAEALSSFKRKGNSIIWLDHHSWDQSSVNALSKYCDIIVMGELPFCGADLVYRLLCEKDAVGGELARIAHFADFAIYPKRYEKLIWNINYTQKILGTDDRIDSPKLRRLVSLLSMGRYDDRYITSVAKAYIRRSKPYMDALMKNATAANVNGVRIAVGFSKKISNQVACIDMLKRFRADVAVYVPTDTGHCSIRCQSRIDRKRMVRVGGVDGARLARTLGGNGHPLASGFAIEVGRGLTEDGIERIRNLIIEKARDVYGNQKVIRRQRRTR
ncbi:MAG: hypothetical protein LVQ95_00680 [Candidatus Micrarchaeales archaeon]|nr:hypothetical protein [Candidatus Micrarchaeales archaeon]